VSVKHSLWALGFATTLAACAPSQFVDRLPAELGLPASAPARPEVPYEYPAVHDMPPDRASSPLTEEEQVRVEKELISVRDRQEGRPAATKKGGAKVKKQPKDAQNGQTDGAKANP